VDESWKEAVQKERSGAPAETPPEAAPETDFLGFVSTLAMQVLMALGEIPHPGTGETRQDLPQARYLIDILQILSDKTRGNLTPAEASEMKNLLYELQVKFVKKSQEPA
jgi:hypothetical protein